MRQEYGIKLSNPSKMPCSSWSLEALKTCPASIDFITGELVDACKGCYATGGNYRFENVKAPRAHNREDWKRSGWVVDMVTALDNDRYFRWFDSGDMYHIGLAKKIFEVMKRTPWVKHWLPTRMHKFKKFQSIIDEMNALPNVVVRLSSDSVLGEIIEGEFTSTIVPEIDKEIPICHPVMGAFMCRAYDNGGKCGTCRACWDKNEHTIVYKAHGQKMKKVIMRREVKWV